MPLLLRVCDGDGGGRAVACRDCDAVSRLLGAVDALKSHSP